MFCKNCGDKLEEEANFCSNCGTKIIPKGELENRSPVSPTVKTVANSIEENKKLQNLLSQALTAKFIGDGNNFRAYCLQAMKEFPNEPNVYRHLAEAFSRHLSDVKTHAAQGLYLKAIEFAKIGFTKLDNVGYTSFNKGTITEVEGELHYWLAYSFTYHRLYGAKLNYDPINDAKAHCKKAVKLLNSDKSRKLLDFIKSEEKYGY